MRNSAFFKLYSSGAIFLKLIETRNLSNFVFSSIAGRISMLLQNRISWHFQGLLIVIIAIGVLFLLFSIFFSIHFQMSVSCPTTNKPYSLEIFEVTKNLISQIQIRFLKRYFPDTSKMETHFKKTITQNSSKLKKKHFYLMWRKKGWSLKIRVPRCL